jgi:hypothetical protein
VNYGPSKSTTERLSAERLKKSRTGWRLELSKALSSNPSTAKKKKKKS